MGTPADPTTDEHGEHGTGLALYIYVFVALCVLTGASFFTVSDAWPFKSAELAWIKWTFMMAVSVTKAFLVIIFFMHLKYEKSWKYMLTIPTLMMAVFLMLMLVPDIGRRTRKHSHSRDYFAAEPSDQPHEHDRDGDSE